MNKVSTKNMSEQEWLALRQNSIGGSDAAALLGKNKYTSKYDVYLSKIGEDEPFDGNKHTRYGTLMEPIIADVFGDDSGCKVQRCHQMVVAGEHDHIHANIDRKILGRGPETSTGVLECKATNSEDWAYDINPQWYIQLQHYIMLFGYDYGYIAWEHDRDFKFQRFKADKKLHEFLQEQYYSFWNNHVIPRVPPKQPSDDIEKLLKPIEGERVVIDDDIFDIYLELMEAKNKRLEYQKREKELKKSLDLIFGDAEKAVYGDDVIATRSYQARAYPRKVDKLKEEHPQIYEKYFYTREWTQTNLRKVPS